MCERRQLQGDARPRHEELAGALSEGSVLYYTNEMTMKEIGESMGVNESRMSQIHKAALKKMQTALESEGIHSAAAL